MLDTLHWKHILEKLQLKFPRLTALFAQDTVDVLKDHALPKKLIRDVHAVVLDDASVPYEQELVDRINRYRLTAAQIDALLLLLHEKGCFDGDPTYGTPITHSHTQLFDETALPRDMDQRIQLISVFRNHTWLRLLHNFINEIPFPEIAHSQHDAHLFGKLGTGFSDMWWNIAVVSQGEELFAAYVALGNTFLLIGKRLNQLSLSQKDNIVILLKEMILACREQRKTTRDDAFREDVLNTYLIKFHAIIDSSPGDKEKDK